jgi:hypothetical protein
MRGIFFEFVQGTPYNKFPKNTLPSPKELGHFLGQS